MNKRIRELREQAMEWVPNQVDPDTKIRLLNAEKFAELIVRECSIICKESGYVPAVLVSEDILLHFGVEE
jgi:hypothetical protein